MQNRFNIIQIIIIVTIALLFVGTIVFTIINNKKIKTTKTDQNDNETNFHPINEIIKDIIKKSVIQIEDDISKKPKNKFYRNLYDYARKIMYEYNEDIENKKIRNFPTLSGVETEIIAIMSEKLILKFKKDNQYFVLRRVISSQNIFDKEAEICKRLDHPNIMKIYKVDKFKEKNGKNFETITYIVSEFLDVAIDYDYPKRNEFIIRDILKDVVNGLKYLHSQNIVHLDLKIYNIMGKSENGSIVYKIIDFEYARDVGRYENREVYLKNRTFGTRGYHSPELLMKNIHGFKSDIWTIGVIAWYLSLGYYYFQFPDHIYFPFYMKFLSSDKINFHNSTSTDLKDFIRFCLQRNPLERPNIDQISEHPFLLNKNQGEKNLKP